MMTSRRSSRSVRRYRSIVRNTVFKGVASRPEDMLDPSLARRVHDIKTSEKEVARMSGIYARRIEEGREEGRKEGAASEKVAIAYNMLHLGMELSQVSQMTRIPREKVGELWDNFKKHRSAIIEEYGLGQGNAPVR